MKSAHLTIAGNISSPKFISPIAVIKTLKGNRILLSVFFNVFRFSQIAYNSLYVELLSSYTAITIGYTEVLLAYSYTNFYCKSIKKLTICNIDRFIVNASLSIAAIEVLKLNKWTQNRKEYTQYFFP
ncbi:hypothetical protein [uncultured Polaribacter sp.]|uniref:hypothetical protein n=1 Tax=uncultured Polaribacter sp. TaxID=174711 RepID=UPI00260F550E|nr:hypothetical protein [uncultured Polaribacter sp.]